MTPSNLPFRPAQTGRTMPVVAVILIAVVAGFLTFKQFGPSGSSTGDASDAEQAELASLQETLTTSLALPLDFKTVADFQLQDVNDEPITQSVFDNTWSVVFFGYTHCPDVCPITLQVMKNVVSKLEEQNQTPPQVVFVSVDPVRDTSDVMKQYIGYFNPSFVGITGELQSVHEMTKSLGIVASFTANDSKPEEYIVDHTASLLLIDPQRRVRAKITPPHEVDTIVADYLKLTASPS